MFKLDYSLQSSEERLQLVNSILQDNPTLSSTYLDYLADYLTYPLEKEERKQHNITTQNRQKTLSERETSLQGLSEKFEAGEDALYSLMTEDCNQIFHHKIEITAEDLATVPFLSQVREAISYWKNRLKTLHGKDAYIAKQAIIDLSKDQYLIRSAYKPTTVAMAPTRTPTPTRLSSEEIFLHAPLYAGVSLLDPKVCSAILRNYSKLRSSAEGNFLSDTYYLMEDFDRVSEKALAAYPIYNRIAELKIDGLPNKQIRSLLLEEFDRTYTPEYLSSLWRNKIPKLIASAAEDEFLDYWFLNREKGTYKKCGKCGQIKLALPKYFSRNNTSKDKCYSICKACRNKKGREN